MIHQTVVSLLSEDSVYLHSLTKPGTNQKEVQQSTEIAVKSIPEKKLKRDRHLMSGSVNFLGEGFEHPI